jgi:predicted ArsR family transcriptional regulator
VAATPEVPDPPGELPREDRLQILKALGDNTRYAIYLELARSAVPLATAEVADTLGLHVNTVRPHLERMRELGLVERKIQPQGVGRPQHRYSLAPDAPSLGLEPPTFPLLAALLAGAAALAGVTAEEAAEVGRDQGHADAQRISAEGCLEALSVQLTTLGFDPAVVESEDGATVAFTHCPFAELAAAFPEVVCHLHRGMVEGLVAVFDDADVADFRTCTDRAPCQVDLVAR